MAARASDRDDDCPACGWACRQRLRVRRRRRAVGPGCGATLRGRARARENGAVIAELLATLETIAMFLVVFCTRPERVEFGVGWINGVSRTAPTSSGASCRIPIAARPAMRAARSRVLQCRGSCRSPSTTARAAASGCGDRHIG